MLYGVTFTGGRGNMTVYTDGTNLLIYESITNAAWNALEWSAFADGISRSVRTGTTTRTLSVVLPTWKLLHGAIS